MSWQCELAVWSVGWQCELAVWQSAADDAPKEIECELFELGADVAATTEAARLGADAILVSPVFASRSPSAGAPLGAGTFSAIVAATPAPVYALGGVTAETAAGLVNSGAAGLAGIEGFNRL